MTDKREKFHQLRSKSASIEDQYRATLLKELWKNDDSTAYELLVDLVLKKMKPRKDESIEHRFAFFAMRAGLTVVMLDRVESLRASFQSGPANLEITRNVKELRSSMDSILDRMIESQDWCKVDPDRLASVLHETCYPYKELMYSVEIGSAALMHRIAKEFGEDAK
jgi:hypothetical protein